MFLFVTTPSTGATTTTNSNGITFDNATLNDPVRMVGEPDIEIDHHGGIYVSGPGGSTTQASWFWKSDDKGIQWHSIGVIPEGKAPDPGGWLLQSALESIVFLPWSAGTMSHFEHDLYETELPPAAWQSINSRIFSSASAVRRGNATPRPCSMSATNKLHNK